MRRRDARRYRPFGGVRQRFSRTPGLRVKPTLLVFPNLDCGQSHAYYCQADDGRSACRSDPARHRPAGPYPDAFRDLTRYCQHDGALGGRGFSTKGKGRSDVNAGTPAGCKGRMFEGMRGGLCAVGLPLPMPAASTGVLYFSRSSCCRSLLSSMRAILVIIPVTATGKARCIRLLGWVSKSQFHRPTLS